MIPILLVAGLIAYGTLYPWDFSAERVHDVRTFLAPRIRAHAINYFVRDFAVNVALYMPLGMVAFMEFRRRWNTATAMHASVLCGFALSSSLEVLQLHFPSRVPSVLDIMYNVTGALTGAAIAVQFPLVVERLSGFAMRRTRRSPGLIALLAIWAASHLLPFIPYLTRTGVTNKLAVFWRFDLRTAADQTAAWFIAGGLLVLLHIPYTPLLLFASVLMIPLQLLVLHRQPELGAVIGALLGSALWLATRAINDRARAGAALLLMFVAALAPFQATDRPNPFALAPFTDALENTWTRSVTILLGKTFIAGGAIALLEAAGVRVFAGAAVVASVLAAGEVAQIWIDGRTPATTDPALAILAGAALVLAKRLS